MHPLQRAALLGLTGLAGCSLHLDRDTRVDSQQQVGSIYQVDGHIELAPGATAGRLSSVSAPIHLQQGACADSLRSVDGAIQLDPHAAVSGDVRSVDGPVRIDHAQVLGQVGTLVAPITLHDASVGRLQTVSGTIRLNGHSLVSHDIVLEKPRPDSQGDQLTRLPTVVIGPGARVLGRIIAERGGQLWVSRDAQVGAISGTTVQLFDGDAPPAASELANSPRAATASR